MIARLSLRVGVFAYLAAILLVPVGFVFWRTFEHGFGPAWDAVTTPDARHALWLTLEIAAIAVPLNTVFGVLCALAIVRRRFPGKGLLNAVVDLPLALSPVVAGLAIVLLYGRGGWFESLPFNVLYATPAMVLATIFVSLPFVVREVVPVLREIGTDQEEASATLGAGAFATFRRVTFPAIRWAVVYGVVLTTARSIGEYGAVRVVSGNVEGKTQTMTLLVQDKYEQQLDPAGITGAYAASVVLALIAIVTLLLMTIVRPREETA
jgi:sulfate/thiosulfate transport system permease protein